MGLVIVLYSWALQFFIVIIREHFAEAATRKESLMEAVLTLRFLFLLSSALSLFTMIIAQSIQFFVSFGEWNRSYFTTSWRLWEEAGE